ncbi:hypothetical protein AB0M97_27165 [Streptomyces sp. NPDC051207]|uniref:hypothetical protein n=1 Tax=Streptomyces sp. NPDC051207 TaxID=3154641 RepID=UPI003421434C
MGTLWPVPDGPTARIARDVYAALIPPAEEPQSSEHSDATSSKCRRFLHRLLPFTARRSAAPKPPWSSRTVDLNAFDSAHALHRALLRERDRLPDHPSAWVSFVHYGV